MAGGSGNDREGFMRRMLREAQEREALAAERAANDGLTNVELDTKITEALRTNPALLEQLGIGGDKPPKGYAPVGGLPPEFGGTGGGGEAPVAPAQPMPNGGVPTGTTAATPTSPWSYKAPQLQVGVTDPAPPVEYDMSHLQQQPLQSAADKFGGATETARALRSGIGSRYAGGR